MKRAKQFYMTIIVLSLIIISVSTYYTLGGFDSLEVFVSGPEKRTVIGKEYVEKYDFQKFSERFKETRAAIDSARLEGQLAVLFFENEKIKGDTVHYFVGAAVDEIYDVLRLPAGYTYKEFTTNKVFKVFITQHWLVRPVPEEIKETMEIKAIEEGAVLQPVSFELYYKDESLSVERWAK